MPQYSYQTVQLDPAKFQTMGPRAATQAWGAGVKLLQKAAVALNDAAVLYRVNYEIDKLRPDIDRQMPAGGGVLLLVQLQEWECPDPVGNVARTVLSVSIAGSGKDPGKVLRDWMAEPHWLPGAVSGWIARSNFIWITGH